MTKLKFAESVLRQKKDELQLISETMLDAKVVVGRLTLQIPKATPNNNPFLENYGGGKLEKT